MAEVGEAESDDCRLCSREFPLSDGYVLVVASCRYSRRVLGPYLHNRVNVLVLDASTAIRVFR